MHHPTDATTTPELISEALAAAGLLPPLERLAELDDQLRTRLATLTPVVQKQADELNRGTTAWYSRARALQATRNALTEPLSGDRRYAAMQAAELGRRLNELSNYAADGQP